MKLKTVLMAAVFALTLAVRAGDVSFTEYTTIPDKGSSGANNAVILPIQWKDIRKIYVKYAYATAPSKYPMLFATSSDNVRASSRGDPRIGITNASTIDKSGLSSFVFTATPGDTYGAGATVHEATMTFTSSSANYFLFGCAWDSQAYCATIDWYAVKLYDSSDTLLANMIPAVKDDVVGFYDSVSGNFYDRANASWPALVAGPAKHAVTVAGAPHELGSPNPGYGERGGQTVGSSVTFTCPPAATNAEDTIRGECAGWTLKKLDGTTTSDSGTSTTFTYDDSFCLSTLTWRWNVRYAVDVRKIVNGKLVGSTRGWTETDGSITLACPDVPADCEFAGWYGSGVSSDIRYEPSLSLTMSAPGTVYAVFRTTGAANKLCLVDYATGADDAERDGGTLATAWKTFAYAVSRVADGDVIVLCKGTHVVSAAFTIGKAITVLGDGAPDETVVTDNDTGGKTISVTASADFALFTFHRYGNNYTSPLVLSISSAATDAVVSNIVFSHCGIRVVNGNSSCVVSASAGRITQCVITNCQSYYTGVVYLGGAASMENCYLADNICLAAGILSLSSGSVMRNCTIVDNHPTSRGAVNANANAKVYNCLIWGNTDRSTGVLRNWEGATAASGNWIANCTSPVTGLPEDVGNIGDDPLMQPDLRHFLSTSPCRGTANATYAPSVDLDGTPRGATPSIGAFEYVAPHALVVAVSAEATAGRLPAGVVLSCTVDGPDLSNVTYAWDFDGDGTVDSTEASPTIDRAGVFNPRVTVTAGGQTASSAYPQDICIHSEGAATYYVDYANGVDDAKRGLSSGAAWKTLKYAISRDLVADGDTLVLMRGTHTVTAAFTIDKAITLRGEGTSDETVVTDNDAGCTITVTTAAKLESFTFYAFGSNYACPMVVDLTSAATGAVISNMVFRQIGMKNKESGGGNGAHPIRAAAGLFTHCYLTNNSVCGYYLLNLSGKAAVEDCYIGDNTTRSGGTIGIVSLGSADNVLKNCTIVDNTPVNVGAVRLGVAAKVYNNIVWGNVDQATGVGRNWSADASHTANWLSNCTTPTNGLSGAGNIVDDPLLKDDRMHFKSTSPCRGKANATYATATDLDGTPRGATPSIGAFEYVDSGELELALGSSATFARLPGGITLTASITGAYAEPLTYSWSFKGDGHEDSTAAAPTIETVGTFRPSLTVTDANGKTASASFEENLTVHAAGATTYYVDYANGDNGNDGFARSSAWKTVQHAVTRDLVADGDTVVLLRGTHVVPAAFSIDKAITVRGDGAAGETVLTDNDTGGRKISIAAAVRLESVTFYRYGNNYTAPLALSVGSAATGAVVSNVVFSQCGTAYPTGGNSSCVVLMSAGLITHSVITNCQAFYVGAVEIGSAAKMENCLISDNKSTAQVILRGGSGATIRNCTFVGNHPRGSAAFSVADGTKVCNNIIWANTDWSTGVTNNWSGATAKSGNWIANCTSPVLGLPEDAKNIEADPQLTAKKPYHLEKTSPCRNGGEDSYVTPGETDLDGKMRKIGRHVDMGCYEQDGPGLMLIVR